VSITLRPSICFSVFIKQLTAISCCALLLGCGQSELSPDKSAKAAAKSVDIPAVKADGLKGSKPNILVFIADDAGWKDYGTYGNPVVKTPTIDLLAKDGLKFEQAMLTIAQCSPSRVSILSGKYPHSTKAEDLHIPLPEDGKLVPHYLKQAGYFNGNMFKQHYGLNGAAQFDWYSDKLDDFGIFLDTAGDKPFFMWTGFHDPHRSYSPGAIDEPHDPNDVIVPKQFVDTPQTRQDIAYYYDEIGRLDLYISRMMADLENRGMLENTLVVFLSDNGMPWPGAKGSVYDMGIGTPLIMRMPSKIKEGDTYEPLTSVVDLAPTFLDLAGVEIPADMQGRSIIQILEGDKAPNREMIFSERNWHNCDEHNRAVRTEKYKLIKNGYPYWPACTAADIGKSPSFKDMKVGKHAGTLTTEQARHFVEPRPVYELYDLTVDPDEFANVAGKAAYIEVQKELTSALEKWIVDTNDLPPNRRTKLPNTDRWTGKKFTRTNPALTNK
jgi:N-sulfoglucosamine sulfohydrolase